MNDIARAQALQRAVKPKFRGHTTLKTKVVTHYPENLEREYVRITNTYMTLLNKTLAKYLPTIREAITAERESMRRDAGNGDIERWVTINGTPVPIRNGKLSGPIGAKIQAESDPGKTASTAKPSYVTSAENTGDFRQWVRENRQELKNAGKFDPESAEKIFRDAKYEKDFNAHEISEQEAVDIIRDKVPTNVLNGWFREADSTYKTKLENIALNDDEVRNAAMNLALRNYKEHTGESISLNEFLNKEITVYRGKAGEERYVEGDQIMSYSLDPKIAEGFSGGTGNIKTATIKPIDTIGHFQSTGETEFFVRRDGRFNADSDSDLQRIIEQTFLAVREDFARQSETFGLQQKLDNLARLTRKLTIREWRRVVQKTLGVDIVEDYYMGEFYRQSLVEWTTRNTRLITSVPQDTISQLHTLILDGYRTGMTNTAIGKEIQATYGIERRKARFWARDQLSKLHSELTQAQQSDAGVEEYVWSDSGDERVRDRHRYLSGKTFSWHDPPVVDERTGRRAHPGEDYDCRCVALPKFNLPGLDLPWVRKEE